MFRTSYRLTAAMGGIVSSSIAVMSHQNPDPRTGQPPVSLIPVNHIPVNHNHIPVIPVNRNLTENVAASVGPGLDNVILTKSLDTVTIDRGEEDGEEDNGDMGKNTNWLMWT